MDKKKKTIIEEALLDYNKIQEAIKTNSKEILRTIMNEEIEEFVKESVTEADYDEEDIEDVEMDVDVADVDADDIEAGGEEAGEMDADMDSEIGDYEGGDEEGSDMEDMADYAGDMDMTMASDEDVISVYKKLTGEDEIEVVSDNEVTIKDPESGAEYHVKLGAAAEGEVEDVEGIDIADEMTYENEEVSEEVVYEITLDEDEVNELEDVTEETKIGATAQGIVRGPGHDTHVTDSAAPNTGDIEGQKAPVDTETSGDNLEGGFVEDEATQDGGAHGEHVMETEEVAESEEVVEETEAVEEAEEVTETEEVSEEVVEETEEIAEEDVVEETEEVSEQIPNSLGKSKRLPGKETPIKGPGAKNESVEKYNKLLAESKELKKENAEFKKALKDFKERLTETAVFNTNLAYATKLFMEHTTTKAEKKEIMRRFDEEVMSIKESQKLYKSIKNELETKTTVTESVDSKINKTVDTSSTTKLNESTVYVDASTKRINDLIKRVEGK